MKIFLGNQVQLYSENLILTHMGFIVLILKNHKITFLKAMRFLLILIFLGKFCH
jgi:hypothetical protein